MNSICNSKSGEVNHNCKSSAIFRHRGRLRHCLLRMFAIVLGFLPIAICEAGLRLFSVYPPINYDPFLDLSGTAPLFVKSDDVWTIPIERQRLFAEASFANVKSPKTRRVFCIGGSTTQGEPYKPPTAFPKWVEINLTLAAPYWDWEVVNCGGLSYASYRMLPIVNEILEHDADLVMAERIIRSVGFIILLKNVSDDSDGRLLFRSSLEEGV